jgi:glutamate dehydrogenase/leucine dehydrogenase
MMDTTMHAGYTVPGVVTGKPISLGGSEGRNEATARGCVYTIVEGARHLGMDLKKSRVAVQGFGNAGSIAARLIREEGATVVAVSDSTGRIHNPDGLDIAKGSAGRPSTAPSRASGASDISNAEVPGVDWTSSSRLRSRTRSRRAMPTTSRPGSSPRRPTDRRRPRPTTSCSRRGCS